MILPSEWFPDMKDWVNCPQEDRPALLKAMYDDMKEREALAWEQVPKVKKLVWHDIGRGHIVAVLEIRTYQVSPAGDLQIFSAPGYGPPVKSYGSVEKAKAVAQEHFEKLVRECLE